MALEQFRPLTQTNVCLYKTEINTLPHGSFEINQGLINLKSFQYKYDQTAFCKSMAVAPLYT